MYISLQLQCLALGASGPFTQPGLFTLPYPIVLCLSNNAVILKKACCSGLGILVETLAWLIEVYVVAIIVDGKEKKMSVIFSANTTMGVNRAFWSMKF